MMIRKMKNKHCIVPECTNSSDNTPNKYFFSVPLGPERNRMWLTVLRKLDLIELKTRSYCCEDHFDLEQDTENYIEYKIMAIQEGKNTKPRLKKDVVPHIFQSQEVNKLELSPVMKNSVVKKGDALVNEGLSDYASMEVDAQEIDETSENNHCKENPSGTSLLRVNIVNTDNKMDECKADISKSSLDVSTKDILHVEWMSKPDVCRCCITTTGSCDLTSLYMADDGGREVLLQMLEDCYGIVLSNISEWGPSRFVCDSCATRLRYAYRFKQQVLQAEDSFKEYLIKNGDLKDVKNEYDDDSGDIKETSDTQDLMTNNKEDAPENLQKRMKISRKQFLKKRSIDENRQDIRTRKKMINSNRKRNRKAKPGATADTNNIDKDNQNKNESMPLKHNILFKMTCNTILNNTTAIPLKRNKSEIKCFYCDETFKDIITLREHTKTHNHSQLSEIIDTISVLDLDISQLKCTICDIDLIDIENTMQHFIKVHNKIVSKECIAVYRCDDDEIDETNVEDPDEMEKHDVGKDAVERDDSGMKTKITYGPKKIKQISKSKRVKTTCETILKYTTACPFRHHKSWFQCFYCTKDFMEMCVLKQHMKENHTHEDLSRIKRYPLTLQIDISEFQCKICNIDLIDISNMVQHYSDTHSKVVYKECIADYKINKSPYACHICDDKFHVFRSLTIHLNEHYPNCICEVCGKSYMNTKRLNVHKRTHEMGIFPCTECGKVLKTKTAVANHMESHYKRIIKCQICFKTMKHYNQRIKHMSEEHNITHKFICPFCPRVFKIKHYLATHIRQTHGHKSKKCSECGMAFITNHGLKKHMLKHTGVKAFACSFCSKTFARSYTLREHMRGHESGGKFAVQ